MLTTKQNKMLSALRRKAEELGIAEAKYVAGLADKAHSDLAWVIYEDAVTNIQTEFMRLNKKSKGEN